MVNIKTWRERAVTNGLNACEARDEEITELRALVTTLMTQEAQPRLTVRLRSFPESNGKRNWTAHLVRVDKWDGLVGSCGGISLACGELWNRVAYQAERTRFLLGERDTEPFILDYGDDIKTPEEWKGEDTARLTQRNAKRNYHNQAE